MTSSGAGIVSVIVVFCLVVPSLAKVYTVGDSTGWTTGVDYTTWASSNTFNVGDSLAFNYGSGHTVDEVSASDYSSCTVGNAITSDSSGATTISLKTAGSHYFICGVIGHCSSGMKVGVTVAAASTTTPSTGTPSTTPSSSGTNTTSPTTTTPSSSTTTTTTSPSSTASSLSAFVPVLLTFVAFFVSLLS